MSMHTRDDAFRAGSLFARSVRDHWVLFLAEGIVLIVLGFLAVTITPLATLAVTIFLGWLLLISGAVGLVTTIIARHAPGFFWSLLSAAIGILAGIFLIASPLTGSISLILVLIVFFIIEGVASIMYAIDHHRGLSGRWGWLLSSGIVDLFLAGIVFAGPPQQRFGHPVFLSGSICCSAGLR